MDKLCSLVIMVEVVLNGWHHIEIIINHLSNPSPLPLYLGCFGARYHISGTRVTL